MSEYKLKAEAYVRDKLPELMELSAGCLIQSGLSAVLVVLDVEENGTIHTKSTYNGFVAKYRKKEQGGFIIFGHPIQLQHWLKVLEKSINGCDAMLGVDGSLYEMRDNQGWDAGQYRHFLKVNFNLTTGQPATEEDYKVFCEIVDA